METRPAAPLALASQSFVRDDGIVYAIRFSTVVLVRLLRQS
jgi:hypothetical protein